MIRTLLTFSSGFSASFSSLFGDVGVTGVIGTATSCWSLSFT